MDSDEADRVFEAIVAAVGRGERKRALHMAEAALRYFMDQMDSSLLGLSKCDDFVVNRGHYFGTPYGPPNRPDGGRNVLTEDEKQGLKEFLKTL